jgi:ribosome biogenesis GTPase
MEKELQGLVYKSTGSWYSVRDASGSFWSLRAKGKLKIDKDISSTNPVAVGDHVVFEADDSEIKTGDIKAIKDRHNYIVRVSPHNRHQKHIVASNIDAALVMATITEPRTSNGFIDRFLITAEAYHIPAIIVINKTDLLKAKHKEQLVHWIHMYESAGYTVYPVSALQPETIEPLHKRIAGITTLFSGHSGVGKSTLINYLIPGNILATQEVSGYSGKGQHTTTFAEMFDLPGRGRIIDTPGVKEFGLIDIEREELAQYFPEMRRVMQNCKFNNCLHINEPGCAVKEAVNNEGIAIDRYVSYMTILDSIEKKW